MLPRVMPTTATWEPIEVERGRYPLDPRDRRAPTRQRRRRRRGVVSTTATGMFLMVRRLAVFAIILTLAVGLVGWSILATAPSWGAEISDWWHEWTQSIIEGEDG